jgi:hypothetical protein
VEAEVGYLSQPQTIAQFFAEKARSGIESFQYLVLIGFALQSTDVYFGVLKVRGSPNLGHRDETGEAGVIHLLQEQIADFLSDEATYAFSASGHVCLLAVKEYQLRGETGYRG